MPFATNDGVRIHYEIDGTGQPLVLVHGGGLASSLHGRLVGFHPDVRCRPRHVRKLLKYTGELPPGVEYRRGRRHLRSD